MAKTFLALVVAFGVMLAGALAPVYAAAAADGTLAREKVAQKLVAAGEALLAEDKPADAIMRFESALVANPKSTAAYVGLGRANGRIERPNAALKYYAVALSIDPNDRAALEAQSIAFLDQGKINDAEQNLARLKRLCAAGCAELDRVNAALKLALDKTEDKLLGRTDEARKTAHAGHTPGL
ncbi:MAG: hypothetical protein ACOY99_06355 [Pseudomonadota bacterium]